MNIIRVLIFKIFIFLCLGCSIINAKSNSSEKNESVNFQPHYFFQYYLFENYTEVYLDEFERIFELNKPSITESEYLYYKAIIAGRKGLKKEAEQLFQRSSNLGHPKACLEMFYRLEHTNLVQAVEYLTCAAEKGESEAQFLLGTIYFYGRGGRVKIDKEKAVNLLLASAQMGDSRAIKILTKIDVGSYIPPSSLKLLQFTDKVMLN